MNSKEQEIEKRRILDPLIDKVFGSSRSSKNKNKSISKRTEALAGRISSDLTAMVRMTTKIETSVQKNENSILTNPEVGADTDKASKILDNMLSFMQKSREQDTQEFETKSSFNELNANDDADRHKEIMDVFIEATKKKRQAEKDMAKKAKKRKADTKKEEKKPEPAKKGEPAAKTETKQEAPKQEAPKQETPSARRTTGSTPSEPSAVAQTVKEGLKQGAKTATRAGAIVGVTTAQAIGRTESGGNYDVSFGDSFDKKAGKMVNKAKDPKTGELLNLKTPEEFSGKKLTEMTLAEVKAFGEYRSQNGAGAGAVGAYQFMPSTLFGRKDKNGNLIPGLVQQLKLSMNDKFDKETQDKLQDTLHSQDVATLKRLGVPITPGYEYMAHYIGAGGASAVFRSVSAGENKTVAQVIIDSGKSVGNNKELYEIEAKNFEKLLQGRLEKKGGLTPHSEGSDVGQVLSEKSQQNTDMAKDLKQQSPGSTIVVSQNNTNNQQKTVVMNPPRKEELNPTMRN